MNGEQKPNDTRRKRRERLFIPPPGIGIKGRPPKEAGASSVLKEYISSEEESLGGTRETRATEAAGSPATESPPHPRENLADEWESREENFQNEEAEARRLRHMESRLDRLERRLGDFENTCYSFLLHAKRLSDRAVSFYEDVFGLSKEDLAYIHDRLGINSNNNGDYEKAIESFRKVVEFDDKNATAHFKLGVAYDNGGSHREAIECYRKTVSLNPKLLKAYYRLADIYANNENYEEAVKVLSRAIELAPDNAESLFRLGTVHADRGNHDEAVASYLRVVNLAPTFPGIYRSLGLAYERKGDHDKAIECFKKSA